MKRGAYISIVCIAVFCALLCLTPREVSVTNFAMDTAVTIKAEGFSKKAVNLAIAEIKRLDRLMSTQNPKSDVYKINSAPKNAETKVDGEVFYLIEKSVEISKITDGAFDITVNPLCTLWDIKSQNPQVPSEEDIANAKKSVGYQNLELNKKRATVTKKADGMTITLGAIAKGYATDKAVQILKDNNVKNAIIDFGGNIYILGKEKRVGLQTPFEKRGTYFDVLNVSDVSVVSSGAYERYFQKDGKIYHHIIDAKSGYPAQSGADAVSVVHKKSCLADALSTAVFVSGEDRAKEYIKNFPDAKVIIRRKDGTATIIGNN